MTQLNNIVTEASDLNIAFVRTSVYSFIKNNPWFNGTLYLITHPTLSISSASLNSVKAIYNNIQIISATSFPSLTQFFELNKKYFNNPENVLSFLKYSIFFKEFDDSIFYFNSKSLFFKDIRAELKESTQKIDNDFNFALLSNQAKKSLDFIKTHNYLNESTLLQETILAYGEVFNFSEFFYTASSSYPDIKFKQLSNKISIFSVLVFNNINNPNLFKINQIWLQKNREAATLSNRPVKKNNMALIKKNNIKKTKNEECISVNENIDINSINFNLVSVIIPAFGASDYIEECLDSIVSQDPNIEILVGIDNCKATLSVLEKIKTKYLNLKVYFSNNSVGPYVIRNSLAQFVTTENILFFDADDIMSPKLISTLLANNNGARPIRFKYINFQDRTHYLNSRNFNLSVAHGVFFIPVSIFKKIGGFQSWKCGADTEFIRRCDSNGFKSLNLSNYLFYRRIHPGSLTQNKKTNFQSPERLRISKWIKSNKDWKIPIKPTTITLIEK